MSNIVLYKTAHSSKHPHIYPPSVIIYIQTVKALYRLAEKDPAKSQTWSTVVWCWQKNHCWHLGKLLFNTPAITFYTWMMSLLCFLSHHTSLPFFEHSFFSSAHIFTANLSKANMGHSWFMNEGQKVQKSMEVSLHSLYLDMDHHKMKWRHCWSCTTQQ